METMCFTFVKFGRRSHIESLYSKGLLHIETISYFKQAEDSGVRGDRDENLTGVYQPNSGTRLFVEDKNSCLAEVPLKGGLKTYIPHHDKLQLTHIYSLSGIFTDDLKKVGGIFDDKIIGFGDTALVIERPKIFHERFIKAFEKQKLQFHHGKVEYVPENYHGELGPFRKFNNYSWQREYRFGVISPNEHAIQIEIGSLTDIAKICPIESWNPRITNDGENILLEYTHEKNEID